MSTLQGSIVVLNLYAYHALVYEKLRTADELYDFMIEEFH
jgi:hypothetical protein